MHNVLSKAGRANWTKPRLRTRQDRSGQNEGKKAGRKQPSCTQKGKTAGEER